MHWVPDPHQNQVKTNPDCLKIESPLKKERQRQLQNSLIQRKAPSRWTKKRKEKKTGRERKRTRGRKEGRKDMDISPCSSVAGLPMSPLSPSLLFLFRLFLCPSFFSFFSTWSQSEHKDAPKRYQGQWGSSRGTEGRRKRARARKRLEMHEEDCVTGRRGFRVWGKILDTSTTLGTTTVAVWTRKPNSRIVVVSSFAT